MRRHFVKTIVGCAFVFGSLAVAANAHAQAAQAAPATPSGIVVAAPTYTSIPLEVAVNRPAAEVWKRVGKYCDIGEWLRLPCTITSGKDGEFGAIRSVANEILVGKDGPVLHLHAASEGRASVQPVSRHARGAAGDGDHVEARIHAVLRQLDAGRRCRARTGHRAAEDGAVHAALENMKILAEGGTLPPAPARGTGTGAAPGRGVQPR